MRPVKVKTVQIKAGQMKLASAGPVQQLTPITNGIAAESADEEISGAAATKTQMPQQPANHGTGRGILGAMRVSSGGSSASQAMASANPLVRVKPQSIQQNGAIKPVLAHTGWIIQVGALESEGEARQRIEAARSQARDLLGKADPFTEAVVAKGEKKLFRARFAGLDRDQAEAACRTLKRSEISCITIRN
jgi:D-alanyl-D-alanine carboxypeptidase